MQIGYLDVPLGAADRAARELLVHEIHEAICLAYPTSHDTQIFLREWRRFAVSGNGVLGSDRSAPVFILHTVGHASLSAKRLMHESVNAAIEKAFGLARVAVVVYELPPDSVSVDGVIHADQP